MRARSRLMERARGELAAVEAAHLDVAGLVDSAGRIIERAVPYDAACWHTMDPVTLVETSSYLENLRSDGRSASEIEYLHDDFNKFAGLARGRRHSGVLSDASKGDPGRSRRYRVIVEPNGLEGELRASFVVDGKCWGCFGLFREAPADFDADEAAFVHDIASSLGRAFRAALIRGAGRGGATAAPGLVLFDAQRRVEAATPAAHAWFERFRGPADREGEMPYAVYTVADEARRVGSRAHGATASARIRAQDGGWIMLNGAIAEGAGGDRVAVILEASRPAAIAPLLASAYRLSKRERDVIELVLQGCSTSQIAERLSISRLTVQQHLKAVFAKVGVHSRRELIADVFLGQAGLTAEYSMASLDAAQPGA